MTQINIGRKDRILFLWYGSAILVIITFFLVQFKIRPHGDFPVALHYNVLIGVDAFGRGAAVYIIPAASLFVLAFNFLLYKSLARREKFLAFLTAVVAVIVSFVLCAAVVFLFQVN